MLGVYGDLIIQTIYPRQVADDIDDVYIKAKDFESFDAHSLIKILKRKTKLKVMIMKNSLITEQLRQGVLSYFK